MSPSVEHSKIDVYFILGPKKIIFLIFASLGWNDSAGKMFSFVIFFQINTNDSSHKVGTALPFD
jgi:hypothetical protein